MRLFVAVTLPDAVRSSLCDVRSAHPGVRGRGHLSWEPPSRMHVTLRFLGEACEEDAKAALRHVRAERIKGVRLAKSTGRFGGRVLHVPVFGLDDLATAVTEATKDVGEPPDSRGFAGHVTLARTKRGAVLPKNSVAVSAPHKFDVDHFVLMQSTRDEEKGSVVYIPLERFDLDPVQERATL